MRRNLWLKLLLCLLIACISAFSLTACGFGGDENGDNNQDNVQTPDNDDDNTDGDDNTNDNGGNTDNDDNEDDNSGDDDDVNTHTHSFIMEVATDEFLCTQATCKELATYYFSCECGEVGVDVFAYGDYAEHEIVEHEGQEATCTEDGWEPYETCENCEYSTFEEIYASHDIVEHEGEEATCTEDGYEAYETCKNCEYSTYKIIPASHNFQNLVCVGCGEVFYSEGLEFEINEDGQSYSVEGIGSCEDSNVSIPYTHQSLPVTSVGSYAFEYCTSLTSIAIPDSVTSIGNYAFHYCISLTSIVIPDSIKSIGDNAFLSCGFLTSIEVPDSVTIIGKWAFSGCASLTSINVDENNANYKSIDGNLYSKDGKTLIQYAIGKATTEFTIPNVVTSIGEGAFKECVALTSLKIPDSVTNIGDFAFSDCTSLTNVVIGNSVTSIGDYAFRHCDLLTQIELPISVTYIGACAFLSCKSLTNIVIGNDTMSIASSAFLECNEALYTIENSLIYVKANGNPYYFLLETINKDLSTYTMNPETVLIGNAVFGFCQSLSGITIPDSVTSIGYQAFIDCTSLTRVDYTGTIDQWAQINFSVQTSNPLFYAKDLYIDGELVTEAKLTTATKISAYAFYDYTSLTSVVMSDSVTSIGDRAFLGCSSLTSVVIGNNVTSVGESLFIGCYSLRYNEKGGLKYLGNDSNKDLYLADTVSRSITTVTIDDNCRFIGEEVFLSCGLLTTIEIPDSVTSIGEKAFYNCDSLTSIKIPDSVTIIRERMFCHCESLTNVEIGDYVTSIGDYAFQDCGALTSIKISNSVTNIGYAVFTNCATLANVEIGSGITDLGSATFYYCTSLTSITFNGTVEEWNAMEKGEYWKDGIPATKVICIDGDVEI